MVYSSSSENEETDKYDLPNKSKIKIESTEVHIKSESNRNIFPVDMDNCFDPEIEEIGMLGLKQEYKIHFVDNFDGFPNADHKEVRETLERDIFGESDEEGDFEGFDENEVEKEIPETHKKITEPKSERILKNTQPSRNERAESLIEKSSDIMRAFDAIVAKQKAGKKINRPKKSDNIDYLNDMDDKIAEIMNKMRLAAVEDEELYHMGQPGIKKMQLLQCVRSLLRQNNIKEVLIESKFLVVMAAWLKPLPNHILPPLDIRTVMLKALMEFPILNSDILKESNIGKAVMYLFKHPKETAINKKMAGHLINEWSRPIFNLSSNYNGMTREDRLKRDRAIVCKRKLVDNDASAKREIHDEESSGNSPWIQRSTAPLPSNKDYIIRPKWRAGQTRRNSDDEDDDEDYNDDMENRRMDRGHERKRQSVNDTSNKDLQLERTYRRIKDKNKKSKTIQRASTISIQGRGFGL